MRFDTGKMYHQLDRSDPPKMPEPLSAKDFGEWLEVLDQLPDAKITSAPWPDSE